MAIPASVGYWFSCFYQTEVSPGSPLLTEGEPVSPGGDNMASYAIEEVLSERILLPPTAGAYFEDSEGSAFSDYEFEGCLFAHAYSMNAETMRPNGVAWVSWADMLGGSGACDCVSTNTVPDDPITPTPDTDPVTPTPDTDPITPTPDTDPVTPTPDTDVVTPTPWPATRTPGTPPPVTPTSRTATPTARPTSARPTETPNDPPPDGKPTRTPRGGDTPPPWTPPPVVTPTNTPTVFPPEPRDCSDPGGIGAESPWNINASVCDCFMFGTDSVAGQYTRLWVYKNDEWHRVCLVWKCSGNQESSSSLDRDRCFVEQVSVEKADWAADVDWNRMSDWFDSSFDSGGCTVRTETGSFDFVSYREVLETIIEGGQSGNWPAYPNDCGLIVIKRKSGVCDVCGPGGGTDPGDDPTSSGGQGPGQVLSLGDSPDMDEAFDANSMAARRETEIDTNMNKAWGAVGNSEIYSNSFNILYGWKTDWGKFLRSGSVAAANNSLWVYTVPWGETSFELDTRSLIPGAPQCPLQVPQWFMSAVYTLFEWFFSLSVVVSGYYIFTTEWGVGHSKGGRS